jgi:thioredoxin-like negative regulator of GroEL
MSNPVSLKTQIEEEKALMIYFYNDDCAPCLTLRPKVEHLMTHYFPKMKLIFVNSKSDYTTPAAFQVYANPTILLFFEGKESRRFSKFVSIAELQETIGRYYSLLFGEMS